MTTEYDEELGYDADHDDPAQYCPHGTWIGSWWGPDYLCGWCEDGISVAEMRQIQTQQAIRRATTVQERFDKAVTNYRASAPYDAMFATVMTCWLWDDHESERAYTTLILNNLA